MNDIDEYRSYGDPSMLEPIVEQQDDETTISPMSSSIMDTSFLEEERLAHEEIRQFEELEKECATPSRGIRVKFSDKNMSPTIETTVITAEPYFQVNSTEDQVTKDFYENQFSSIEKENNEFIRKIPSKTPSEPDSLEEEHFILSKANEELCGRSILKRYQQTSKLLTEKSDRSTLSRTPSPCFQKKKGASANRTDSNEIQHLAEVTAKQTRSKPMGPLRSLFEPTINIFDSSNVNQTVAVGNRRPSRLRYYIKPYRGETYIYPDVSKQRSRSLSEQRLAQQPKPTIWHTFSNQYNRSFPGQVSRKQHVSWSPVREYIHRGRDTQNKISTKVTEQTSEKFSTFVPTANLSLSSSSPCLRNSSSMIPVSIRYRTSHQIHHPSSVDSYETSSMTNCSLTPITPISQYTQYEDKKDTIFKSPLPDVIHRTKKEHNETMQRYDRLLEKMRATDEQLQLLSRSWVGNSQHQKTLVKTNLSSDKITTNKELFSPMMTQMCFIILVIFNLFLIYFFNDINVLWSRYVAHPNMVQQHNKETSNF